MSGVRQLKVLAVAGIWPRMRIQTLIATLIALAMALAPLAAPGAAAAAAPAAGHHAQMMDSGHCDERQPGEYDKGALDQCCVATCAAAALNAPPALDFALAATAVPNPSPEPFGRGYLADLPTPPPRRA